MSKPTPYNSGDIYGDVMLTGKMFDKILGDGRERRFVEVLCDCGKIFYPLLNNLRGGKTKSCGCKVNYYISKANTTHGLTINNTIHPILLSYRNMILRCDNKDNIDYGGRGIEVCDEWRNNFQSFYDWSIENGWKEGLTLDRFPNNETGIYEPSNCRWATDIQQARNKRNNVFLTAFGETKLAVEWVEDVRCSVGYDTLLSRINRHKWSHEDAITKALQIHNKCQAQS